MMMAAYRCRHCNEPIIALPLYGWTHVGPAPHLWCTDADGLPSQFVAERVRP